MKAQLIVLGAMIGVAFGAGVARAETKVELKSVHMCCEGCSEEVAEVLGKVEGVTNVKCEQEERAATFTARDDKVAQQALDALAKAGFHGDPGKDKPYAFKDDSGVKPGKVKSLTLTGFHNTCPGCVKSFKDAIKDVKGITGNDLKSKVTTTTLTGDFDAAELVKALNKAGFHVKVKQ